MIASKVRLTKKRDNFNEYAAIYYELTKISDLARDLDVHVLGVHHLGKSQTQSEEQILGSTAFFGASDGAFLITREKNMGRIRSNMRYGTSLEETYFTYDSNFLISAEGSASDVRTTDIRTRILEIISNAHGPIELSAILEKVEARSADVKRSLNQMVEESILIVEGSGFKGSPLKYSIPTLGNKRAEEKQGEP